MAKDFHHDNKSPTYWLPKDEEEQYRLTGQHIAIRELYQGNLSEVARKSLDFEKGISVLDVGCGSGAWTKDMANDYPNCTFIGFDMVYMVSEQNLSPNISFQQGNILNGLPFPDNSFDFVHMRLFVLALKKTEWPFALQEILRVTKSGGMAQVCEYCYNLSVNEAFQRLIATINNVCSSRAQEPYIGLWLGEFIHNIPSAQEVYEDYVRHDMSSGTEVAKLLVCNWLKVAKIMMRDLGYNSLEEQGPYLKDLEYGLLNSESITCINVVTVKKQ